MRRIRSFLLILATVLAVLRPGPAAAESVALTFDDGFDPRSQPQAARWNQAMLQALATADVKAMLFPAGKKVDSPAGLALVRAWGEAGHAIGNHTYAHRSLASPRVSLGEFTTDVLAADTLLHEMPGWTPRLRFPYLKEGDSADKRDGLRDWMALHGYQGAPVSIDTSDWYYAERFAAWRGRHPKDDAAKFRKAYLEHLWNRAQHYDTLARKLLGRSPRHVILLHTSGLNAAFLPEVIAMFRSHGWTLVSPQEAYDDPMYKHPVDSLPAGESVVWAIARHEKRPGLRYPAEDAVYEKAKLDKLGL